MLTRSFLASVCVCVTIGCAAELDVMDDIGDVMAAGDVDGQDEQAMVRSCAPAQTVRGIDVSYYQGRIDWPRVRQSGVDFAIIRVSDGITFVDPRFEENWRGARAAGVKRGAYQFFRSNRDPIAQADLLLEQMGPLEEGDLPPVIDVESTDGQSSATIQAKVQQWLDRVESVLGARPIIYTGPYFWRDQVRGGQAFASYPLWIAHYGTSCPLIPEPWSRYTMHQTSDSGRVPGITGNVDTNTFAGSRAQLDALGFAGGGGTPRAPPASTCEPVPAAGRVIDEEDACFQAGGPAQYLRAEAGEGFGGGLLWTHTTSHSARTNYGEWTLRVAEPGRYRIAVFTDSSVATSQLARYRVDVDGEMTTRQLDQRLIDGWRELAVLDLRGTVVVTLNDNTGEPGSQQRRLVFDALKIEPATGAPPAPTEPPAPTCGRVRVVNAAAGLNVRPAPSTARAAVGQLQNGSIVERVASVDGQPVNGNRTWHQVERGDGLRGYVSAFYTSCVD